VRPRAHPGLQPERTALAWRRTALSVTVGSLVGLRVLPPQLGALGYAVSALGLLWGLDLVLTARRRYRDGARMLRAGGDGTPQGPTTEDITAGPTTAGPTTAGPTTAGAAVARTAVISALVGLAALVAVVVLSTR
jgi:hypothetical protein